MLTYTRDRHDTVDKSTGHVAAKQYSNNEI